MKKLQINMAILDRLTQLNKTIKDCEDTLRMFSHPSVTVPENEVARVEKMKQEAEKEREYLEKALTRQP